MGLTWGNIKKGSFQCTDSKYYQQKESKIEFAWESKKRSNSLKMEQHTFIFIIHYYREYRKTTLEHCCIYHSKEQSTVGKFTWFFLSTSKKVNFGDWLHQKDRAHVKGRHAKLKCRLKPSQFSHQTFYWSQISIWNYFSTYVKISLTSAMQLRKKRAKGASGVGRVSWSVSEMSVCQVGWRRHGWELQS